MIRTRHRSPRLLAGTLAVALAASTALVACGSDADSSGSDAGTGSSSSGTTKVTVALDYIANNASFVGFYVAEEKGYYDEAGLDVDIKGYSTTTADVLVNAGKADFGTIDQPSLIMDRAAGQPLTAVMAIMQHEPLRLAVATDAADDIDSPKDLADATFGGFGIPMEAVINDAVITEDGADPGYKNVTLGTDVYNALTSGQVDWALPYETDDILWAEMKGEPWKTFDPRDFGVPDSYAKLLFSSEEILEDDPETAEAFVAATVQGFEWAQAHPEEATDILIGADVGPMDEANQKATAKDLAENYWLDPDGVVGPMTAARWEEYGDFLAEAGVLVDADGKAVDEAPDTSTWFTDDYLPAAG